MKYAKINLSEKSLRKLMLQPSFLELPEYEEVRGAVHQFDREEEKFNQADYEHTLSAERAKQDAQR